MKIEKRDTGGWKRVNSYGKTRKLGEKINKNQRCMEKPYGILLSCNPNKNITGKAMCWVLLSCCDTTSWSRKLTKAKSLFGPMVRVHDGRM